MSNDKLLQEVYDKIRELDIKLAKKELTLSERDVEVERIQLAYETGPNMKNELAWLEWNLKNIPMSAARRQAAKIRIDELSGEVETK